MIPVVTSKFLRLPRSSFTLMAGEQRGKFLTDFPERAKFYDPTLNGGVPADQVKAGSNGIVLWVCPEGPDHQWKMSAFWNLRRAKPCPYCSHDRVSVTNCLATRRPDIAAEFHPTLNGDKTPESITWRGGHRLWWKCPKGDDHVFVATLTDRVNRGVGCPFCAGKRASTASNMATEAPELLSRWHPTKNGSLRPEDLRPKTKRKVWWICDKGRDHEWQAVPRRNESGEWQGCPFCRGLAVSETNRLDVLRPDLAEQWSERNKKSASEYVLFSKHAAWWKCPQGPDHKWQTTIANRSSNSSGCPFCVNQRVCADNNLAFVFPDIAAEYDIEENAKPPEKVLAGSKKKVWWRCLADPEHTWQATVQNRTANRSGCPLCMVTPRSKQEVELAFEVASIVEFDLDAHKFVVPGFRPLDVDIVIESLRIAIEFDGSYWHADKADIDRQKTVALAELGWRTIRVREHPLLPVGPFDVVVPSHCGTKVVADLVLSRLAELEPDLSPAVEQYLLEATPRRLREAERYLRKLASNNRKGMGSQTLKTDPDRIDSP